MTSTTDIATLNMVRKAIARADTVVSRFVEQSRTVVDRIVRWLPWPFSSIVESVARVIREVVEVFDFSSTSELTRGSGATHSPTFTNNGRITNAAPTDRRLRIDRNTLRFGPGPEAGGNIGWHQDEEGRIVLDEIAVDSPMYLELNVGNGSIDGEGEIFIQSVIQNVEIINETDTDLVLGNLNLVNGQRSGFNMDPQIFISSGGGKFTINNDIVRSNVSIVHQGDGDVILTGSLENACADIYISAARNIIAASPETVIEFGDAGGLFLSAGGDIGSPTAPLMTNAIHAKILPDGSLNRGSALLEAVAGGDVHLQLIGKTENFRSNFDRRDEASGVAIQVRAQGDIRVDIVDSQVLTDVLDDEGGIHHTNGTYQLVNVESQQGSVFVNVNLGDLLINRVSAPSGNVTLIASRSLIGGFSEVEVAAASTTLIAGKNIGTEFEPLSTNVETLAAQTGWGDMYLDNATGLKIGEGDGISGLSSGSTIELHTTSKLVIAANISAKRDILLDVRDTVEGGEVIEVENEATVSSLLGDIRFEAADGVTMGAGTTVSTPAIVEFNGEPDDEDLGIGVDVRIKGTVNAGFIRIATGNDRDTIDLADATLNSSEIQITTGGGDDTIIGSSAAELIEPGSESDSVFGGGGGDLTTIAEISDRFLGGHLVPGERFDEFWFEVPADKRLSLVAVTYAGDLVTSLTVYNPAGDVEFFGTGPFSILATNAGIYRVLVASVSGSGDYELRVPLLRLGNPGSIIDMVDVGGLTGPLDPEEFGGGRRPAPSPILATPKVRFIASDRALLSIEELIPSASSLGR